MGSRPARSAAGVCFALVALVVACSAPAAAQSVNRNLIQELNTQLLYVALPLAVFVEVILVYAVFRFRDNPDPRPTIDSPNLEITWTAATAIILLFVGVSAYAVLATPYFSPGAVGDPANDAAGNGDDPATIRGLSYRYDWQFRYPDANLTTRGVLVLPADRTVRVRLSSADVIHSLFVPQLGIKKDAFPGKYTRVQTRASERGSYRGYCTELCGPGHSTMRTEVVVVAPSTYRSWVRTHRGESNVTDAPSPPG